MSKQEKEGISINTIATIISLISIAMFLDKIFGKSDGDKKADESRDKEYQKTPPTYEDYMYQDYADVLHSALITDSDEDEETVYSVFKEMKNISDIEKLIEAFDTKRELFSFNYITLPQAIGKLFDPKEKNALNTIIARNGIKYRFK